MKYIILLFLVISCTKTPSEKITYELKKPELEKDAKCQLQFDSSVDKNAKFEYIQLGRVQIDKSYYAKVPVMAEEIHKLINEVSPNLCKSGANYVQMMFSDTYLKELLVYERKLK